MTEHVNIFAILGVDPSRLKTEERILYAAMNVFAQHPFGAASIRMISKEAGVTLSSVMYHFQSKERLYEAVFGRLMEAHELTLGPFFERVAKEDALTSEKASTILREMISATMDELYSTPEKTVFARIMFLEFYFPSPLYDSLYERFFKKNYDLLIDLVMAYAEEKDRRRGVLLAVNISGQIIGFRMERQFLKRYIGLVGYSPEEAEEMKKIVLDNVFLLLGEERKRNTGSP